MNLFKIGLLLNVLWAGCFARYFAYVHAPAKFPISHDPNIVPLGDIFVGFFIGWLIGMAVMILVGLLIDNDLIK